MSGFGSRLIPLAARLEDDSPQAWRAAGRALAVAVTALSLLLILTGACPQRSILFSDALLHLDGGWRLLCGLRPHTDHVAVLGPVAFAPFALGLAVRPDADALAWAPALLGPLLALAAWAIARPRWPAAVSFLYAVAAMLLVAGPRAPGHHPFHTGYAMLNNRWGWAWLWLIVPLALLPAAGGSGRRVRIEGAFAGALLPVLLLLKLNYAAAAGLLLGLRLLLQPIDRRFWSAALAGCAGAAVLLFVELGISPAALWRDEAMVASFQSPTARSKAILDVLWFGADGWLFLLAAAWSLRRCVSGARVWLAAGGCALLGLLVCSTNTQVREVPLYGLAALLLGEMARRAVPEAKPRARGILLAFALAAISPALECVSLGYATVWKATVWPGLPAELRFRSPALAPLPCPPHFDPRKYADHRRAYPKTLSPFRFTQYMNDADSLLRPRIGPESRVLALDWINPLPFALGLPPPSGFINQWFCRDLSSPPSAHPAPEFIFRDTTHVMRPKRPIGDEVLAEIDRIYGSFLTERYEKAVESELWILYEKRRIGAEPEK